HAIWRNANRFFGREAGGELNYRRLLARIEGANYPRLQDVDAKAIVTGIHQEGHVRSIDRLDREAKAIQASSGDPRVLDDLVRLSLGKKDDVVVADDGPQAEPRMLFVVRCV